MTSPGAVQAQASVLYNRGSVTPWFYVTGIMSILMFINGSLVASALAVAERDGDHRTVDDDTGADRGDAAGEDHTGFGAADDCSAHGARKTATLVFAALPVPRLVLALPGGWEFSAVLAGIGIGRHRHRLTATAAGATCSPAFVNPPLTLLSGASSPIANMPSVFSISCQI